jgi:hypothetical protein
VRADATERLGRGIYLSVSQRAKAFAEDLSQPVTLNSVKTQDAKVQQLTYLLGLVNKLNNPVYTLGTTAVIGQIYLKISELRFAAFQASNPKETAMENSAFAAREKAQSYLAAAQRMFASAPYSPVQSSIYETLGKSFPKDFPHFTEEVLTPVFTEVPWTTH